MRPIDQQTLAAVGGQTQLDASRGFMNSMAQFAQSQMEKERIKQQQEFQEVQLENINQQMLAREQQMLVVEGQQARAKRALNTKPPGANATADEWFAYGKIQEAGGYAKAAGSAYDIGEAMKGGGSVDSAWPEIVKLNHFARLAAMSGDNQAYNDYRNRIKKLSTEAKNRPLIEGSPTTMKTLKAYTGLEDKEQLAALTGLSRTITEKYGKDFDITQGQVNAEIGEIFNAIMGEREQALGKLDYIPFVNPETPTAAEVEQVFKVLIEGGDVQAAIKRIALKKMPAPEEKTVEDTKNEMLDDALSKY